MAIEQKLEKPDVTLAHSVPAHAHARVPFTPRRKQLFLELLAAGVSVEASAKAAGIGRRSAYDARAKDSEFAEAWGNALDISVDMYVERLREIALTGPADSLTTVRAGELCLRARVPAFRGR